MSQKQTPMIQQYLAEKEKQPDAFLFFRVGDFYEMFFEDAKKASQLLELTLTAKNKNTNNPIPMCGVPHHSVQSYIDTLVDQGYKVAICDQVETPQDTKEMLKREIVQVVTPGTKIDQERGENNYLTCIETSSQGYVLSYVDLGTGELQCTELETEEEVINECGQLQTREVVRVHPLPTSLEEKLKERFSLIFSDHETGEISRWASLLENIVRPELRQCIADLLGYVADTQQCNLDHLQPAQYYQVDFYLQMDYYSKFNLELKKTIRTGKAEGTLFWLLNETKTAMGKRQLQRWIDRPLVKKVEIVARQEQVQTLMDHYFERQRLVECFKGIYDLERLVSKVALGRVNARELGQLKQSLQYLPEIIDLLEEMEIPTVKHWKGYLPSLMELTDELEKALVEELPLSTQEGGMIRKGYDATLDQYIEATENGVQWILELEAKEREKTGVKNLRIKFNNNSGYYIEVSKAAAKQITDERYIKKQTLANSERFSTVELKDLEKVLLEAKTKRIEREYELFVTLREKVKAQGPWLQRVAEEIATLDVLQSFAVLAEERNYCRPTFNEEHELKIIDGRHPVIEKVMESNEYVPNDIVMDKNTYELLITGPNMSGKSTYMRQLALTVIMAQMGSFVPASQAELPLFDQIFTRIGASDDLYSGKSTFMVEMMEASEALRKATPDSLLLFDELGRGTATFDGMALAQAIIEYIQQRVKAKTLFSTHYHELTVLADQFSEIKNIHVSAKEENGQLIFLHKMQPGAASQSYGIEVARLAQLPEELLVRAEAILQELESKEMTSTVVDTVQETKQENIESSKEDVMSTVDMVTEEQLSLFQEEEEKVPAFCQELEQLDLMQTTPLDALLLLHRWQKEWRER